MSKKCCRTTLLTRSERATLALMLHTLQSERGFHTSDAPRLAEFDIELNKAKQLCEKLRCT